MMKRARYNFGSSHAVSVLALCTAVLLPAAAHAEGPDELGTPDAATSSYGGRKSTRVAAGSWTQESDVKAPVELAQVERRRPGGEEPTRRERKEVDQKLPAATTVEQAEKQQEQYKQFSTTTSVPPTDSEFLPAPDRWTMLYQGKWYDPYNQNILKGDLKLFGEDDHPWFLELTAMSNTLVEQRRLPTAVGVQSTSNAGSTDVFGNFNQTLINEDLLLQAALINGNTTFKPQEFELRVAPIINFNHLNTDETGFVRADPARGTHRDDAQVTLSEAFVEYHLVNISDRFDFVSSRFGIQKFNSDFRGFIFNEEQPGARFFGNYENNKYQWNLAYFHRLEKDVNSGLNKMFESRAEDVFIANLYDQDAFFLGHDIQFSVLYRDDTFGDEGRNFDENGLQTSPAAFGDLNPKNVRNTYLGFNTNGHIDRLNMTSALYYTFGSESHNQIAGRQQDISAWMTALEFSYDIDWIRPRASFFWASGDDDPYDGKANGFDAIFDNPNFAGGENSYYVRQGIPLIAGGGVALTNRLSLLADLRSSKEQGQSNFVNPGIFLYNLGLDIDVTPKLLMFNNANWIQFDQTAPLNAVRQDGSIGRDVGLDLSTGLLYRPFLNNNVQFKLGAGALYPGQGLKNLYGDKTLYQAFTNFILMY